MIYLHIGRHKTGTSALQQFLRKNRAAIGERGFDYVLSARGGPANHDLAHALNPARMARADPAQREVAAEELAVAARRLRHRGDKILSSEGFQNVPPRAAAGMFPVGGTTIVVYLREQLDYLLSAYAQMIQAQPSRLGFVDYAVQLRSHYDGFLDDWATVFGRDFIKPRLYVRDQLRDGDIRRDFLAQIGLDGDGLWFNPTPTNPSIGPELIEAKGLINAFVPQAVQVEHDVYRLFKNLTEHMPGRLGVSSAFAQRVRTRFAQSNARLFASHFPEGPEGFPLPDFTPPAAVADRAQALERALTLIAESAPEAAAALRQHLPARLDLGDLPPLLPVDWDAAAAALGDLDAADGPPQGR